MLADWLLVYIHLTSIFRNNLYLQPIKYILTSLFTDNMHVCVLYANRIEKAGLFSKNTAQVDRDFCGWTEDEVKVLLEVTTWV